MADERECDRLDKRMSEMREDYHSDIGEIKNILYTLTNQVSTLTVEVNRRLAVIQTLEEKHSNTNEAIGRAFKAIENQNAEINDHDKELRFYKGAIYAISALFGLFILVASWYMAEQHHKVEKVYEYVIKAEARESALNQNGRN